MASDSDTNKAGSDIGKKIASTELSIPLNIPIAENMPPSPAATPQQQDIPAVADPAPIVEQQPATPAETAREHLKEVIEKAEPVTVQATSGDVKAATNPVLKLIIGAGAVVSAIGIVCALLISAVVGISIVGLGVLIVVSGVLSPKPRG